MCAMSVPPINGYSKVSMASTCWNVAQQLSHAGTKIWDDQGNFRYSLCAGVLVSIPQSSKLHDYLIQIGFNYTVVILAAGSFHYAVWLPCFQKSELKGQWLIFLGKLVENRCTNQPERNWPIVLSFNHNTSRYTRRVKEFLQLHFQSCCMIWLFGADM